MESKNIKEVVESENVEEFTDAQKWFLFNTELDGTLLCDVFRHKFGDEMSFEKNDSLVRDIELNKLITCKSRGFLSKAPYRSTAHHIITINNKK